MFRNNKVRIGLLLYFTALAAIHGPGSLILWLWAMGLAFGFAPEQMRRGILGAAITTANPADYADRQQTLLNRKLLKSLQFNLRLAKFALSDGYAPNGRAIRFFRPRKANLSGINAEAVTAFTLNITPAATPTAITEGSNAGLTLTEVGIGYVDIYQGQRIGAAKISDITTALDLLNTAMVYTKTMGEDAALDYDTVIRNSLINGVYGSNATYNTGDGGFFERFAGVANTGNSATDWATQSGLSRANARVTRAVALGMATQLKRSKIPKIGGNYICVAPPEMMHDMRQDGTWTQIGTFQDKNALFKDAELQLDGVVYEEANNPWIESTVYGTEYDGVSAVPADGLIYSAVFLGSEAFGAPRLNGSRAGGSPSAPRVIILDKADKTDWANQQTVLSWKSYYGAAPFIASSRTNEIGERPRYGVLRVKSTFV